MSTRLQINGLPDRYEVKRELGRGATAVVYLVSDFFAGRAIPVSPLLVHA